MDRLQSMRVFIKVAELGSFCKAAIALEMGNSVVTRHIAELERSLGARLLNRTTRSLSLTESGQGTWSGQRRFSTISTSWSTASLPATTAPSARCGSSPRSCSA